MTKASFTNPGAIHRVDYATGAAAIALSAAAEKSTIIQSVALHLDAAPTTSEDLTITLNSALGAAYDTLLYSLDLSVSSVTDLFWQPATDLVLQPGDSLDIAYTNTDTGTYGLQIISQETY